MVTKSVCLLVLAVLCLSLHGSEGRASTANETVAATNTDKGTSAEGADDTTAAADTAAGEEDASAEEDKPAQYPFRDLPADVLRDFPGLCFGSTALRLFQVGQSWSLTPFCGVATCLVSRDGFRLIERVQDCGPQPRRNPKCTNVNARSEAQFPLCCPVFECEDGVELEYPTQDELQQLAHEAAQAAVRAQYEELEEAGVGQTGRVSPSEDLAEADEPAVADAVKVVEPAAAAKAGSEPAVKEPATEAA